MFVNVRVPVEPDSVRVDFRPSGFTFSASSVPAFGMELSNGIIPERSSFSVGVDRAVITLRKRTAGEWAFLDRAETKILYEKRDYEEHEGQQRMMSVDSGRSGELRR